jgi:uncharacterized protein (DUF58 family)
VTAPGLTATAALSQGGAATTLGGAALLFIAAISAHPALVSAGALMWGVVAFALARARARANALSSLKLRLAPVAVKPRGAPLECVISVSHDGPFPLNRLTLRLVGDGASRIDVTCVVDVPAASSGEVSLSITLPVAGHSMLHGVELLWRDALGLAEATSWRPCAMAIRADTSPLAGARAHALLELAGLVTDHDGRRSAHRRGGGVELRELRDYVPGDPLRAVAWKATARRQRPLVRTTEDDTRHHLQLLVDVGPALRVGPEGERPLDRLLDLAAALLQAASADRVGLTLFDTRIVSHLDAEVGHAALRRCKQRLLDATHLVDDDLTEVPDTEVLARVAAHLDRDAPGQFDFTRSARARASFTLSSVDPLREAIDESAVHTAVARALLADRAKARSLVAQRVRSARWAKDPSGARLRLACAMFGLPLEYRSAPDSAGRNAGFAEALLRGRRPGGPRTLVVLSDLSALDPQGQAGRALRTLSHHKQQVVLLCPPSTPEEAVVAWRRAGATVQRVSSPRSGSSGESPSLRSSRLRPIPSSRDAADRLPPQASTT